MTPDRWNGDYMPTDLNEMFNKYLTKKSIFANKNALTIAFKPNELPHREKEIEQLVGMLAPALRNDKPSNIFIYGKSGTGKSVVSQYVASELGRVASETNGNVKVVYVNCKMRRVADTEYRLLGEIARQFGENVPETGLPTDAIYKIFEKKLDSKEQILILILDEIDYLVNRIGDDILYNFTRYNESLKNAKISLVGISNDLSFSDKLDSRVKSSLSEEEIVFAPYDAVQLQDILKKRADVAFVIDAVDDGVIAKCAARTAQEHGDARKALDLLRVAAEISERMGDIKITDKHVNMAQDKIDVDRVVEVIKTQPKQSQLVLWSIINLLEGKLQPTQKKLSPNGKVVIETGDIFNVYEKMCGKYGLGKLTQRRVSDLIAELDSLGIINAIVISKGRYGRTREVKLAISDQALEKVKDIFTNELYFD